jgi:hypothetical protein
MLPICVRRNSALGPAGGSVLRVLCARLRRAGRDEGGMAIAAVVTLIGVGLAVSGAAVLAANTAIGGTTRDERSKHALAAADAAAQIALFRQNQVDTNVSNPCVVEGVGGDLFAGAADGDGWCPEVSGEVGDATWSYRVSPATETGNVKSLSYVAIGNVDGVTRRIKVGAESSTADSLFGTFGVVGRDWISLDSNARINGNAATNGDITMNSNARVCGYAQVGPGRAVSPPSSQCSEYAPPTQGTVSLPGVSPAVVAAAASTNRFFAPEKNPGDTISGSPVSWDSTTRTLFLDSNSVVTLGGTDYRLCRLELKSNSQLIVAQGARVRLMFDSPENCGLSSGARQIFMDSNTRIGSTSGNPADLQIMIVGSETIPTVVELNSNYATTMPVTIYAPNSDVYMDSNSTWVGGIAGKTVTMKSNAVINADPRVNEAVLPVPLHFRESRYVECSAAPVSNPDDYC